MTMNEIDTTVTEIYDLCDSIWKKQIDNQMHIPDGFDGTKKICTCEYIAEELQPERNCTCVVKESGAWSVCNNGGKRLPLSNLKQQSLLNVKNALLKVWEDILEWEAQWD